jgi:hypothetical protein
LPTSTKEKGPWPPQTARATKVTGTADGYVHAPRERRKIDRERATGSTSDSRACVCACACACACACVYVSMPERLCTCALVPPILSFHTLSHVLCVCVCACHVIAAWARHADRCARLHLYRAMGARLAGRQRRSLVCQWRNLHGRLGPWSGTITIDACVCLVVCLCA